MTPDESQVRIAVTRFYDALESLIRGDGVEAMKDVWHHTDRVTSSHPTSEWARGWEEVLATWTVFASIGKPKLGGTKIRDLQIYVYGDIAYTTCTFVISTSYGGALACTDILQRVDGVWKMIHHHADRSPMLVTALEKVAQES